MSVAGSVYDVVVVYGGIASVRVVDYVVVLVGGCCVHDVGCCVFVVVVCTFVIWYVFVVHLGAVDRVVIDVCDCVVVYYICVYVVLFCVCCFR